MTRIAFVSGSDSNYYPLLREWVHSIRRFPESAAVELCVLDAGLTEAQRQELAPLVQKIVAPDWPQDLPARKARALPESLKACVCRPFIRELFPNYDLYVWIDCDIWVQDWATLWMFCEAAAAHPESLIITNENDRAYATGTRVKWLGRWPWRVGSFYFSNAKKAFSHKIAKALLPCSVMSAGCFALPARAPHWERWQTLAVEAASHGKAFTAEQLTLGMLVYLEGYKAEFLPAYTHWLCSRPLKWDEESERFVEPYYPHHLIGAMHLTAVDALRASHKATKSFQTLQGGTITRALRYPHLDAGDLGTGKPRRG